MGGAAVVVVVMLVIGVALFEAVRRVLLATQNPNVVPALILLGAAVAPAAFVAFVYSRRLAFGINSGTVAVVAFGAGFAALETMGCAFVTLIRSGGKVAIVDNLMLLRGILSPSAHMAWTGLTAAALWYAAEHRFSGRSLLRLLGVYVLAVALHAIWDSVGALPVYVVLSVVSLGLLGWFAHRLPHRPREPQTAAS